MTLDACEAINEKVGLPNPPPEEGSNASYASFTGTYGAGLYFNGTDEYFKACQNMTRAKSGPSTPTVTPSGDLGDVYYYYVVLLAR